MIRLLATHVIWLIVCMTSVGQTGPGGIERPNGSSELDLWLKADSGVYQNAGTDLAGNGDRVQQWNDQSGNNRHLIQSTSARRPRFIESALNGQPVIRFSSSARNYLGPLSDNLFLGDYTIFIVAYGSGSSQDFMAYTFSGLHGLLLETSTSRRLRFLHRNTLGVSGGNSLIAASTRSSSRCQVLSFSRGRVPGGRQQFWINGSDNRAIAATDNYFTGTGTLVLGRLGAAINSRYLNGDMAEVIVFDRELNRAERIIVENYLAAKYGLSLAAADVYDEDNTGAGNFDFDVAGIGRVDASNVHEDSQGEGIVRILNPTGLGNNEFLIWGHDNGALNGTEMVDVPATVRSRFDRVWRVSEVNLSGSAVDVGAVDMRFDLSGLGPVDVSDLRLLVDTDNDGSFTDESPIAGATVAGTDIYQFSGVTALANNRRFSLGSISNQTPLPVELISFTARVDNARHVSLDWQTATEVNNDYFSVERSRDLQSWEFVEEINGAGNSSSTIDYHTVDRAPYHGLSYYRLEQTDFDGTKQYSHSVPVHISGAAQGRIKIYPSPAIDQLIVEAPTELLQNVAVFNAHGQNLTGITPLIQKSELQLVLDVSALATGMFFIKLGTETYRFYK